MAPQLLDEVEADQAPVEDGLESARVDAEVDRRVGRAVAASEDLEGVVVALGEPRQEHADADAALVKGEIAPVAPNLSMDMTPSVSAPRCSTFAVDR